MSAKRTKWFPQSIPPARVGVYNASICRAGKKYRHWNGQWWSMAGNTPDAAYGMREARSVANRHGNIEWRGLAEEPKA